MRRVSSLAMTRITRRTSGSAACACQVATAGSVGLAHAALDGVLARRRAEATRSHAPEPNGGRFPAEAAGEATDGAGVALLVAHGVLNPGEQGRRGTRGGELRAHARERRNRRGLEVRHVTEVARERRVPAASARSAEPRGTAAAVVTPADDEDRRGIASRIARVLVGERSVGHEPAVEEDAHGSVRHDLAVVRVDVLADLIAPVDRARVVEQVVADGEPTGDVEVRVAAVVAEDLRRAGLAPVDVRIEVGAIGERRDAHVGHIRLGVRNARVFSTVGHVRSRAAGDPRCTACRCRQ